MKVLSPKIAHNTLDVDFPFFQNWACMDEVIADLQKIKFGNGYLTAEKKVNKEEDSVKGPEDIDPLTLYVGNLAQEVSLAHYMF